MFYMLSSYWEGQDFQEDLQLSEDEPNFHFGDIYGPGGPYTLSYYVVTGEVEIVNEPASGFMTYELNPEMALPTLHAAVAWMVEHIVEAAGYQVTKRNPNGKK